MRMRLINKGGWWKGTEKEWYALPTEEREALALKATGCLYAFPSWPSWKPVKCVHIRCQIQRGEKQLIDLTEGILAGERDQGYLRFLEENEYQKIRTVMLKAAEETGIYDPWKIPGGWQVFLMSAINE